MNKNEADASPLEGGVRETKVIISDKRTEDGDEAKAHSTLRALVFPTILRTFFSSSCSLIHNAFTTFAITLTRLKLAPYRICKIHKIYVHIFIHIYCVCVHIFTFRIA